LRSRPLAQQPLEGGDAAAQFKRGARLFAELRASARIMMGGRHAGGFRISYRI